MNNLSPEEKLALLNNIESKKKEEEEAKSTSIIVKEEELTDDEVLKINDTIMSLGKHKVLQFLQDYDTAEATPQNMKLISDIIDGSFKQNKSIKERQLGINDGITVNNFGDSTNIIKLLQVNGLR